VSLRKLLSGAMLALTPTANLARAGPLRLEFMRRGGDTSAHRPSARHSRLSDRGAGGLRVLGSRTWKVPLLGHGGL